MNCSAKLQNTPPLICISLNKISTYCYIPRSSKHTDTCNGWGRGILKSLRTFIKVKIDRVKLLVIFILFTESK